MNKQQIYIENNEERWMDMHVLEEMGFTKGELRVYFALLELGTTSSGAIIIRSKVSRSKVYEILERLKEKGLVSDLILDNVRHFQALSPKKIFDYLQIRELRVKEQKGIFKKILPELLDKQQSRQSEHQVRVYHGYDGLKTLYLEMMKDLTKKDEYLGFAFPALALNHKPFLALLDRFHHHRAKQGASAKILCSSEDVLNARRLKAPKNKAYLYRVSKHPFPPSVSIFKDTVATFIWEPVPRVFTITSKETAEHYRKFFYELWNSAVKK